MANDIILKDNLGNPVSHSNVDMIGVLAHNADDEEYTQMFTRISAMSLYLLTRAGSDWLVKDKRPVLGSPEENYTLCAFNETDCREYGTELASGNYQVVLLYSAKNLTVGNTYTTDELG